MFESDREELLQLIKENTLSKDVLDRLDRINLSVRNKLGESVPKQTKGVSTPTVISEKKFKEMLGEEKKKLKKVKEIKKRVGRKELEELGIDEEFLKEFVKPKEEKKGGTKDIQYKVYTTSNYGKFSNKYFKNLTESLLKKHGKFFDLVNHALPSSGLPVLSKTYISIILMSTFLAFFGILILAFIGSFLAGVDILSVIIRTFAFAILGAGGMFAFTYFFPSLLVSSRRKAIKNDLPFVIIHMAAVAGSGAQPISIFNLVLSSGEYKGLEGEIKKIVNYVNLFGYSLTTALRAVSRTTPSPEFKDLLMGIISTVESGGNLKSYLKGKAEDTLNTYKLERKKYVQTLSTYSDVYTGVLIAAPLLFTVTLAIINILGGRIGPFTVRTIGIVGTYGVLPLLNIGFLVFVTLMQPE